MSDPCDGWSANTTLTVDGTTAVLISEHIERNGEDPSSWSIEIKHEDGRLLHTLTIISDDIELVYL